ncbi:MAG: PH domain-containing protein [Chloroflexota bacterium]
MSTEPPTQPTPNPAPAPPPIVHTIKLPFPLQEGEQVLQLVRKHWFFLWPLSILWSLYAIVPVIAAYLALDVIGVIGDLGIVFWIVALVWLLFWAVKLVLNYYRYHNDIWLISNQRVVDSFKSNPFNLRVNTADLVSIQDIAVERKGIFATVLHFGDVNMETAGADRVPFIIGGVPDPEHIQLLIDKERDRERQRAGGGASTL